MAGASGARVTWPEIEWEQRGGAKGRKHQRQGQHHIGPVTKLAMFHKDRLPHAQAKMQHWKKSLCWACEKPVRLANGKAFLLPSPTPPPPPWGVGPEDIAVLTVEAVNDSTWQQEEVLSCQSSLGEGQDWLEVPNPSRACRSLGWEI